MEQNKPQTEQDISQQAAVRRQKLADLRAAGSDPFVITKYPQDSYSADLKAEFADLPAEAETGKIVSLAGRMMSKRIMGKASFAHLRDQKGDIQIFVKRDLLGDEPYAAFKKLDIGDIIGVKGEVFRTKMGELSVRVHELTLVSKSLLPLPEKFHGLTDREARYRQRYVDLIVTERAREIFRKRSMIVSEFRRFLEERGFMEVETPMMQAVAGGAAARPFETYHNALGLKLYMRIAPELYLKRLLVGGFEKVFELNRNFRNEGIDARHNPEFASCEFYWAYANFHDLMDLTEELFARLANKVCGGTVITYQGQEIDLTPGKWTRMSFYESLTKIGGHSPEFYNDYNKLRDYIRCRGE